jgi:crotonobetainyl-CoA:carnitine CoA-transferase CaiB-like acyl-CoA transferase
MAVDSEQTWGVLDGLRVVEFGQYVAGPMVGMLLADQGADVIKIERPGGDPARRCDAFMIWNRGKRSFSADLKHPETLQSVENLVQSADVVIENLADGDAERFGVSYERIRRSNPSVIYCSLPGFAAGAGFAPELGWDPL